MKVSLSFAVQSFRIRTSSLCAACRRTYENLCVQSAWNQILQDTSLWSLGEWHLGDLHMLTIFCETIKNGLQCYLAGVSRIQNIQRSSLTFQNRQSPNEEAKSWKSCECWLEPTLSPSRLRFHLLPDANLAQLDLTAGHVAKVCQTCASLIIVIILQDHVPIFRTWNAPLRGSESLICSSFARPFGILYLLRDNTTKAGPDEKPALRHQPLHPKL